MMNRAQRRAAERQGGQPQPQPQQQGLAAAVVEETFSCDQVNVIVQEAQPGAAPALVLRFLVGQIGDVFMAAKIARLAPKLAIDLGEHLVKEGRRLNTGLVIPPAAEVPADLKAA